MDELTGEIDPHASFRNLCMVYGDFNRPVFLEEILRYLSSSITSKEEIEAIRDALRKSEKQIRERQRAKRGRPRAWDNEEWVQAAMSAAYRRRVLHWSWPMVTQSMGLDATRANIRTIQRRELRFAEFIFDAIPAVGAWVDGEHGKELRPGILDDKRVQMWIRIKTGLPFDKMPEECKEMVLALAPLGLGPSTNSWLRQMGGPDRKKK